MNKPKFLKLKGFGGNPVHCPKEELLSWVLEKYQI
jgi:hypothetical protein